MTESVQHSRMEFSLIGNTVPSGRSSPAGSEDALSSTQSLVPFVPSCDLAESLSRGCTNNSAREGGKTSASDARHIAVGPARFQVLFMFLFLRGVVIRASVASMMSYGLKRVLTHYERGPKDLCLNK